MSAPRVADARSLVLGVFAVALAAACETPGKTIEVGETQRGLAQHDTLVVGQVETGIGAGEDFPKKLRDSIQERVTVEIKHRKLVTNVLFAIGGAQAFVLDSARPAFNRDTGRISNNIRWGATVPIPERAARLEMELRIFQEGNRLDRLIGWDDSAAGKIEMSCRLVDGQGRKFGSFLVEVVADIGWSPLTGVHAGGTTGDMLEGLAEKITQQLRRYR
ncbi:MAG: hypothetical protein HY928_07235 [Elusimicrobia bacterium]|nr:hypothetical protein [Elusimicrobiota bacterium]